MTGWWALLSATWRRMSKESLSILAAGIAFQTFFSLFPTLTAVVSSMASSPTGHGGATDRGRAGRAPARSR